MEQQPNNFMFFGTYFEAINQLPEQDRASACYAFCKYALTGELPDDKAVAMFCMGVSYSVRKYQGRGGARTGSGAPKGNQNAAKNNQINQNNQHRIDKIRIDKNRKEREKKEKDCAPTLQQVLDYAKQQNDIAGMGGFACSQQVARDFYDYYAGIGWVLPNDSRTPIVDWRPFLSKWARDPHRFQKPTGPTSHKRDINDPNNFII